MFSSANRTNAICIIFAAANGIATFLLTMYLLGAGLGFAVLFTILLYLFTNSACIIFLCANIRGLCQDLQLESDSNASRINRLSKRVAQLEELNK